MACVVCAALQPGRRPCCCCPPPHCSRECSRLSLAVAPQAAVATHLKEVVAFSGSGPAAVPLLAAAATLRLQDCGRGAHGPPRARLAPSNAAWLLRGDAAASCRPARGLMAGSRAGTVQRGHSPTPTRLIAR